MRDLIKTIALMVRAQGSTRADFERHYEETHVPLALRYFRDWRGYVRNHVVSTGSGGGEAFDCLSAFWYEDRDALRSVVEFMASPASEELRRDENRFMDKSRNLFFEVEEEVLRGDPGSFASPADLKAIALLRFDSQRSLEAYDQEVLPGQIESERSISRCAANRCLSEGPWDRVSEFWFSSPEARKRCLPGLNPGAQENMIVQVCEFETSCGVASG